MLNDILGNQVIPLLVNIGLAVATLVVGIGIVRLLLRLLRRLLTRSGLDPVFIHFACSIANVLLLVFVVILALDQLGVDTSYLFAILAGVLVALGLALQDSLKSLAAGMQLLFHQPFKAGDEVEIASIRGYVEEMNMMTTRLRTADQVDIIVPNAAVAEATIKDFSTYPTRRIDMVIRISYTDDIRQARDILLGEMMADGRVLEDPAPVVTVAELAEVNVDLNVRPWVKNEDYSATRQDLMERIKLAFDEQGITIPYPQVGIHLQGDDGALG